MSGNRDYGEFSAIDLEGFSVMNDVVSAFVGSFLWPIDLQPRIACHNLRYATDVIVMMVGQQNRVRRQIQAFQRIKYRLCLTGIDNDAVPLLVI
ncbi:hypothetical protein D3C87_1873580 [compost metagenome]